ncbi:MAG: hypothetical protein MUF64_13850 [Polyangiaceae bacterium]|jgi:hypothetical protein|nr:hypothetical protein [Polyangiaceae bacterium]
MKRFLEAPGQPAPVADPGGGPPRLGLPGQLGIGALLLLALLAFLQQLHVHLPLGDWLAWRYLACWAAALVFAGACLCAGHLGLQGLRQGHLSRLNYLVLASASGVYLFALSIALVGFAGLLKPAVFYLLPALWIGLGGPSLVRWWRRTPAPPAPPATAVQWLTLGAGAIAVVALYLPLLYPPQASYDAQWYHMPIAEQYAAQGAIRGFDGGWLAGAMPHLVSFLYTWAFLAPTTQIFDKVVLCFHLEFVIFLATLGGLQALIRTLVPRPPPVAWVSLFLFPGIFVYDSGLIGGADHVAAFFAAPILLAMLQLWRDFTPRTALLFAVVVSAALLTKYTAVILCLLPALAVLLRGATLLRNPDRRRSTLLALAALVMGGLVLTAPHWLKNLIFYGDPVYPLLANHLRVRPWNSSSAHLLQLFQKNTWIPGISRPETAKEFLTVLATFSFLPHDWAIFHKNWPVFGSLFTLLTPLVLFLRSRRALLFTGFVYGGLLLWAYINMQDRYLQVLVPLMAALVFAVLTWLWRAGGLVRWAAVALVSVQILWGLDVYFIPSHSMLRKSTIESVVEFLAGAYQGKREERLAVFGEFPRAGSLLPKKSKVLVHENHIHLGLNAPSVLDRPPESIAIGYGHARTMAELHGLIRSFGVTHVMWHPGKSAEVHSMADDLMFHAFVRRHTEQMIPLGYFQLVKVLPQPPPATPPLHALVLGCDGTFRSGLYPVERLHVLRPVPPQLPVFPAPEASWPDSPEAQQPLVDQASLLAFDPACKIALPPGFTRLTLRGRWELYAR